MSSTQQGDRHKRQQRKRRPSSRSLLPFLRAVVGSPVVVELTNDDVMRGTLESVDDGMNLVLSGVSEGVKWTRKGTSEPRAVLGEATEVSTSSEQPPPFFSASLHVRGRRIRFVHLPPTIDPSTIVDVDREARATERRAFRRELLTRAHAGGGDAAERRKKGQDAEGQRGMRTDSETGSDDDDDNNEYYYEEFDDDDEEEEGEQQGGDDDKNE